MAPHLHHHHHQQQLSSSPASPKGQHYATTLDLSRRLGLFDSKYPAQLKGGINRAGGGGGEAAGQGMDWNELLRKFRKHNPNRNRKFPTRSLSLRRTGFEGEESRRMNRTLFLPSEAGFESSGYRKDSLEVGA